MVVLTHFQVDPTPLRAVAWCPPQVKTPSPSPVLLLLPSCIAQGMHSNSEATTKYTK